LSGAEPSKAAATHGTTGRRTQPRAETFSLVEQLVTSGQLPSEALERLVNAEIAAASHEQWMEKCGLVFAFILAVIYFGCSLTLGLLGLGWPSAVALGTGGVVGLIGLFLQRRQPRTLVARPN
jgi:hypothetical protein